MQGAMVKELELIWDLKERRVTALGEKLVLVGVMEDVNKMEAKRGGEVKIVSEHNEVIIGGVRRVRLIGGDENGTEN